MNNQFCTFFKSLDLFKLSLMYKLNKNVFNYYKRYPKNVIISFCFGCCFFPIWRFFYCSTEILPVKTNDTTIIIISSTYYKTSSIYPSNSVVVHFNAHRNTSTNQIWYCISSNSSNERFVSKIYPNKPFFQPLPCQMQTFASNCTTVSNPTYFAISSTQNEKENEVPLLLRNAINEKLPVVSCVSPLFFNERWQINMLSIEIYAYLGVSRQVYPYMSILENGFILLKEYEKLRIIDLYPWTVPDVFMMRKGLEFRNQATAHNDCYLLYREAAEFIIVHDPDDLLFIKNMTNFWTSFIRLQMDNPLTGGFQFGRFNSFIKVSKSLKNTQISKSLESIRIGNFTVFLKSVYYTKGIENINAHFAANIPPNYVNTLFNESIGLFVHARNISFVENLLDEKNELPPKFVLKPNSETLEKFIDSNHFSQIKKIFMKRLKNFMQMEQFRNLSLTIHYYKMIDDCYESVYYEHEYSKGKSPLLSCPTHFHCKFPEISGINCIHAKQDFFRNNLKNLVVFSPKKEAFNFLSENGCNLN